MFVNLIFKCQYIFYEISFITPILYKKCKYTSLLLLHYEMLFVLIFIFLHVSRKCYLKKKIHTQWPMPYIVVILLFSEKDTAENICKYTLPFKSLGSLSSWRRRRYSISWPERSISTPTLGNVLIS